ncbi:MAG: IS481 family transposase [Thermomicrobiales bacterium]|nr:IS481 family transposase [Thermomicrobiales bacterium]
MSKRSKKQRGAAFRGHGHGMQLARRMPWVPDIPTLSEAAKRRLQVVEFSLKRGVAMACEAFGVSRSTVYRWRKQYQPYRVTSLEPRSRAPKTTRPVRWTWEDEQRILTVRQQYPRWGKRKLLPMLREQGCTLSEATVGRILARLKAAGRLIEPKRMPVRRPRPLRPHATRKPKDYQPQRPGDLLQIDTVHLTTREGTQLRQFSAIDVISRVAAVTVRRSATAGTARAFLEELLDRYPIRIRAIQVDGGSEFMAEFEDACAANDIPVYVLPPRSPKLNGRVERFNRTSQEEFWHCYDGDLDLVAANAALRAWEATYNHVRPHQALQMQTPLDYLRSFATQQLSHM